MTNISRAAAQCRVVGAPAWLLVKPEQFGLQPGVRQSVELVGRMAKIQGRKQQAALTFTLDGGQGQRVEVRLRVKSGLFG